MHMLHTVITTSFLLGLLLVLLVSVICGRKVGQWRLAHDSENKLGIIGVAEGAVFALLGLLIAFTFSGAYERFEIRKAHIIEEANAYQTAYMRIDLFAPQTQMEIRQNLYAYLTARIQAYRKIPHFQAVEEQLEISHNLRSKIWSLVIAACKITHDDSATQLVIPAINDMFDKADTGYNIAFIHSPGIIYALLIGLAVIGSFLTGYSAAENNGHSIIHIVSYLIIVASTIFIILNMEFPRIGIIRVDSFDQLLINVANDWKKSL